MTGSYVVTGALGGIGSAVATRLAGPSVRLCLNDAEVTVHGTPLPPQARATTDLTTTLKALGAEVEWVAGRVEEPQTAELLMRAALAGEAALAGVVNCAGTLGGGDLARTSIESWRATIAVHLAGSYRVARAFAQAARLGHPAALVLVTSAAGLRPVAGSGPYGVAKAGVAILAHCVALETARYGARAYALSPWAITRMAAAAGRGPDEHAAFVRRLTADRPVQLPRALEPGMVADTVASLLHLPEQVACIIESAGRQVAAYRRAPAVSFALAPDTGPVEVASLLNTYAGAARNRGLPGGAGGAP